MPGVSGYYGDPYAGGGGAGGGYPGQSRADGYDPYYQGHPRNVSGYRDDPHGYGRPPVRDQYELKEDTYAGRMPAPKDDYHGRYKRNPEDEPYARVQKEKHKNGAMMDVKDDYRTYPETDGATSPFPHYEMDHLATFKVDRKQGIISPMDGIRKLRQMELSTGIWTMRVTLIIEPKYLIVVDRMSGEDMERFPVADVSQPTAVTNDDRRDVYNNIVLFKVTEETYKGPMSEMHLFQCIGRPAHQVVDDIKAAKAGKIKGAAPKREHIYPEINEKIQDFEQYARHNYNATRDYHQDIPSTQLLRQSMRQDDMESVLSDHTDQEVQLLNHCFDDIEKFVGRLQSAAEAYRELDQRRKQRGNKKHKQPPAGEGMLSMRSRPPPVSDFIDIFQKFKLSFNLLARLKPHIHDPNAPELVHFLFTPLSLIVQASRDPRHSSQDIASRVVSPMLTPEAKELLMNCLSSKETNLWYSLGDAWTLSRDEYKGVVPPYNPRFSDGWEPPKSWNAANSDSLRYHEQEDPYKHGPSHGYSTAGYRDEPSYARSAVPMDAHARAMAEFEQEYKRREERRHQANRQYDDARTMDRRYDADEDRDYGRRSPEPRGPLKFEDIQQDFQQELQEKNARVAEVVHPRQGKNSKELSLQKGEIVEVLDSSKKWWKVRNSKGEVGHAPFTILREMTAGQSGVRH